MRLPVPWWNVRVTWLFVVIAVIVIAGAFVASLGLLGELPPADLDLRPDRIDGEAEFDVVVRGYRMDEVDAELARLNAQIASLEASSPEPPDEKSWLSS